MESNFLLVTNLPNQTFDSDYVKVKIVWYSKCDNSAKPCFQSPLISAITSFAICIFVRSFANIFAANCVVSVLLTEENNFVYLVMYVYCLPVIVITIRSHLRAYSRR